MPRMVNRNEKPGDFMMGDKLIYRNREWTIDGGVVSKVKFATVSVEESQEPFVLRVDTTYPIRRAEPTHQEIYRDAVRSVEDEIRHNIMHARRIRDTARDSLNETLNPDHWDFSAWTQARATYECWNNVKQALVHADAVVNSYTEALERADEGDIISALEEALQDVQRQVWIRADVRTTDPMARAYQDVRLDKLRDWFDIYSSRLAFLDAIRTKAKQDGVEL